MSQAFTEILWKISVQAGILALVVWLVTRSAGKAPARFRYALWVLVLVKFLVPPVLHLPAEFAVWNHPSPASPTVSAIAPMPSAAPVSPPPAVSSEPPAAVASAPTPIDRSFKMPDADELVTLLWPIGVLLMGLLLITRAARQSRLLRDSTTGNQALTTRLALAAGMLGVRRIPRLKVISSASTPMLVGLLRPTIVLPSTVVESCAETDLDAMLLHELAHVKRRDMLVLWLYQLVSVLFFFHPAVWIVGRELKREREMACDELVLTRSGIDRADYASGYVSALKLASACTAPVSLAMAEPFEVEKHRVERILHLPLRKLTIGWAAALLVTVAIGVPTFIGCAESAKVSRQPVKSEVKNAPDYGTLRVLSVFPNNGSISAFEPVVVRLRLTNNTSKPISVAYDKFDTRVEVRNESGKLVGQTPIRIYGDSVFDSQTLIPGLSMTSFFVPSAVYQFKKPGSYGVRLMILGYPRGNTGKLSDLGPVRAEATIPVTVRPFDEARLRATCKTVVDPLKGLPQNLDDFPLEVRLTAICSVRNNAALPSLKYLAGNWGNYSAARAIKRVGTPESNALLTSLISRGGKIGKAASSADKMQSVVSDRLIVDKCFSGWTKVNLPSASVEQFLYAYRRRDWKAAESFFSGAFRYRHADELKNWRLFTDPGGKTVQSVLNDPRSKVLRVRKEGKFTYVLVGQVAEDHAQVGCVELQLIGGGGSWQLSGFPGTPASSAAAASAEAEVSSTVSRFIDAVRGNRWSEAAGYYTEAFRRDHRLDGNVLRKELRDSRVWGQSIQSVLVSTTAKVGTPKISGNWATIDVRTKDDAQINAATLELVKEKGTWRLRGQRPGIGVSLMVGGGKPKPRLQSDQQEINGALADGTLTGGERSRILTIFKEQRVYAIRAVPKTPLMAHVAKICPADSHGLDYLERVAQSRSIMGGYLVAELWTEPDPKVLAHSRVLAEQALRSIRSDIAAARRQYPELAQFDDDHVKLQGQGLTFRRDSDRARPRSKGEPTFGVSIAEPYFGPSAMAFPQRILLPRQKLSIGRFVEVTSPKLRAFLIGTIDRDIKPLLEEEERLGGKPVMENWK